jgi:hypothetical protein
LVANGLQIARRNDQRRYIATPGYSQRYKERSGV